MSAVRKKRKAPAKPSLKELLVNGVLNAVGVGAGVKATDNISPHLRDIYVWQEVKALADAALKVAWDQAQLEGPLPDDDKLRTYPLGESTVLATEQFALVAKVGSPRAMMDREAFIMSVAKKFKISPARLYDLADQTAKTTKSSLSKRVIEL